MEQAYFCITLLFFVSVSAQEFAVQYIGDTLTIGEANRRKFCLSKYCLEDAEILFYAATQNASVDPCVDFKEFAVGTFIKYRAVNDRYEYNGLKRDIENLYIEKQRKFLASTIDDKNDPRIVKVMKNFFRRCVDSRYVMRKGGKEIIAHLRSLGGSPLLDGNSWDPSKFNVSNIIQQESHYGSFILLSREISQKIDFANSTILHFTWILRVRYLVDPGFKDMLRELFDFYKLDFAQRAAMDENIDKAIKHFQAFKEELKKLDEQFRINRSEEDVLKVDDVQKYAPKLNVDWVQLINDQFIESMKITKETEIVLKVPGFLKAYSDMVDTIDKGVIADAFVLEFLYMNRLMFIVYPFDDSDEFYQNTRKAPERWNQCLDFVTLYLKDALEFFFLRSTTRDIKKLQIFTEEAIQDFIIHIETTHEDDIPSEVKEKVVEKLEKVLPFFSNNNEKFTDQLIADIYDELNLKGVENLVQSAMELRKFGRKLFNKYPSLHDMEEVDESEQHKVNYDLQTNRLNIPEILTSYPWYHDERPRFFNQATLYFDILRALQYKINQFIDMELDYDTEGFLEESITIKIAYDSYLEWEKTGRKELLLGANRLTPHQLFWHALARSRYIKERPMYRRSNYQSTWLYVNDHFSDLKLNTLDDFRKDFNCQKEVI